MGTVVKTNQTGVIVVDLQGDFTLFKNGSLAVEGTDKRYIETVIDATRQFKNNGYTLFATQDFHPEDHISFYTSHANKAPYDIIQIAGRDQVLWPPHCIQGSENARVLIDNTLFTAIVQKGMDPRYDSYSGFFDDGGSATGLAECLSRHHIDTLVIYGLATDYCVRATVMDAVKSGFKVILVEGLCRGVAPDTSTSALADMRSAGIEIIPAVSDMI